MYVIFRLLVFGLLFLGLFFAIKRRSIDRKRILCGGLAGLCGILFFASTFLPVENLFFTFDSPIAAYEYYTFRTSNIQLVVSGMDCDFVVDAENESNTYLIIPKTENGWKLGIGSDTRKVATAHTNDVFVYVFQYKDTEDYFAVFFDVNGSTLELADAQHTTFLPVTTQNGAGRDADVTYYAHIPFCDDIYRVYIDGTELLINIPA